MVQANIRWPIAKTVEGAYVKVEQATTGNLYQCPECAGRFVARKGKLKRWHFAHYPGIVCSGEGSRHSVAKHLVASMLNDIKLIRLGCYHALFTKPYKIEISDVKVEDKRLDFRCDVTCRIKEKDVCIEIVDTNPPSQDKKAAFANRLIEVPITDLSDDEIFEATRLQERLKTEIADWVMLLAPKHVFIHTWTSPCWKCHKERPVAIICEDDQEDDQVPGGMECLIDPYPPDILSELRKYTKMAFRRSWAVREGYMANICISCGALQGDHPLIDEFLDLASGDERTRIETILVLRRNTT
jgi:hypothetical protein